MVYSQNFGQREGKVCSMKNGAKKELTTFTLNQPKINRFNIINLNTIFLRISILFYYEKMRYDFGIDNPR